MLWDYIQQNFEAVEIRSFNDGERILKEDPDKKQVLYFDDFLGENFLQFDVIQGRANDIYMFLKRLNSCKNKILIMTTREYILNQAKERYAKLDREEFDLAKYTLDINNYSMENKALILYNHLYYSDIEGEYIKNLINDKKYEKIINHKNYNPRIIEAMTLHLNNIAPENYAEEFLYNLENPFRVWSTAFEKEITDVSKCILYALASTGERTLIQDLEESFNALAKELDLNINHNSFKDGLKEIEGTFIQISMTTYENL